MKNGRAGVITFTVGNEGRWEGLIWEIFRLRYVTLRYSRGLRGWGLLGDGYTWGGGERERMSDFIEGDDGS